jgi:hypothetical protein
MPLDWRPDAEMQQMSEKLDLQLCYQSIDLQTPGQGDNFDVDCSRS